MNQIVLNHSAGQQIEIIEMKTFAIILSLLLLGNISAASGLNCSEIFQNSTPDKFYLNDSHSNRWYDFLSRSGHNVPSTSRFIKSKPTRGDVDLLYLSYKNATSGPVEFGVVEFLDSAGRVIDTSGPIQGRRGSIGINRHINSLLNRNEHRFQLIAKIVKKHTHPLEYSNDSASLTKRFSDEDLAADNDVSELINRMKSLSHISFESYIIYFSPSFIDSGVSFVPLQILSDYKFVATKNLVHVVGHSPKQK